MPEPENKDDALEALRQENHSLHEQVKQLHKLEKRLYLSQNTLDKQIFRINLLNQFNLNANRLRETADILTLALEIIRKAFWVDQGLAFLNEAPGRPVLKAQEGYNEGDARVLSRAEWPVWGENLRDRRGPGLVWAEDEKRDLSLEKIIDFLDAGVNEKPLEAPAHVRGGLNIIFPLWLEGEPFGVIVVKKINGRSFSYHEPRPSEKDLPLLNVIQAHVEAALQNALFRRALEARVQERTHELEQANQERRDAQARVIRTEKLAAIGQLAASVAHELRNPLGSIRNAIFYLRDNAAEALKAQPDETFLEMLDLADKEATSAAAIIHDLLDYSRVVKLDRHDVDLNALLTAAVRKIDIPKNVKLVQAFAPSLPPLWIDAQRIQQVLLNLGINAVQAMESGGEMRVMTQADGRDEEGTEWVSFSVKDTGVGILPENMKRIFDPLMTTKAKGTGLGLAICQGIVEAHGGKIDVKSRPGDGSVFRVRLPVKKVA